MKQLHQGLPILLSSVIGCSYFDSKDYFQELRRKEQELLQADYSRGPSLNIEEVSFCTELNEDNSCKDSLDRSLKGSKIYIGVKLDKYKLDLSQLESKIVFSEESSFGDVGNGATKEYNFVDLNESTKDDEPNFNPDLLLSYFDTSELSSGNYNVTLLVEDTNTGINATSRTELGIYETDSMDVSMKLCKSVTGSGKCEGEFTRISNAEDRVYPFAYIKYHNNDGQDYSLRGGIVLFFPNRRNTKRTLRLHSIGEDTYWATTDLPVKGLSSGKYQIKVEIKSSKGFEEERRKEFQVFGF